MIPSLCRRMLICIFIILIFIPIIVNGENNENSNIKIDGHWIYIYQLDDLKSFEINEFFYINNTGESTFNDSFYIWIQKNSNIASEYCNYTPNMASRYNATGEKECFFLDKYDEANLYHGNPITSENKLSYYGQKENFSITAYSISNPTLVNDTIHLNATIGGKSISRGLDSIEYSGIHLTSENQDIGMKPIIDLNMPYLIMALEKLTISNKGTNTELIGFSFSELPKGWTVGVWNETEKLNNISLSTQEIANLTLIITAPSHLASINVRYITQIDIEGKKDFFIKQYLYETKYVSYEVYLTSIDELIVSKDLNRIHDELFWLEDYNRYWFLATANDVQLNSSTIFSVKFEKTSDSELNIFSILLLIFIFILIVSILIMKRIGFFKEDTNLQKKYEDSKIRIKELQEQKKKVLSAIKRIESEFKEGIISKEDYEQLRAAYKKQAVNILKEIDRLEK